MSSRPCGLDVQAACAASSVEDYLVSPMVMSMTQMLVYNPMFFEARN
jgi:hypothetical protein